MNKNFVKLSFIAIAISFFACSSQQTEEITFKEGKNYFVKNTFKTDHVISKKITTQNELDDVFGSATVIGNDGKPTAIDFEKNIVIALICPETNVATQISSLKLVKNKDSNVKIQFKLIKKEIQTFWAVPFSILIIDKEYKSMPFVLNQL